MDLMLLCGFRDWAVTILRNIVVVYITLQTLEQTFRFSMYDVVPAWSTYERPTEGKTTVHGAWLLYTRLFVFLADFMMTRHFQRSMMQERAQIKASVELAELVTAAMVKFDLDAAEAALQKAAASSLTTAFSELLENLRSYQPYLPKALFHEDTDGLGPAWTRPYPEGEVAVAFTDIQSSTPTWETCPAAMKKAMAIHNRIMREAIKECNGYEVKTIGDAFMVAFDS
eukprot:Sspe_Gene.49178::Locus_26227_Transcript_1_1_Confidence_1.000_Length_952::g.49178::m.49178